MTLYKNGELLSRPPFLEADEVQLVVRASKTDPEGETATRNLFRSGAEVCPVAAAAEYLEHLEPLPGEMFLAHITRQDIQSVLQAIAASLGEDGFTGRRHPGLHTTLPALRRGVSDVGRGF